MGVNFDVVVSASAACCGDVVVFFLVQFGSY